MNMNELDYRVVPFSRERQVTIDGGRIAARKHTIHG